MTERHQVEPGSARRFPVPRRFFLDVSPLRESVAYRALWLGQIVSLIGTQMRIVAVAFQVYSLTGSTFAVGMVGLVEIFPLIAFSIVGGTIADRHDRRRVMARSQLGLIASSLALLGVSLLEETPLFAIYAISAVSAAFQSLDRPARSAIVPALVTQEKIPAALALRQVVFQTTQIVGPALGGVLLAVLNEQVAWIYAIDAASFGAAVLALRWVPRVGPPGDVTEPPFTAMREGLRFAWRNPLILSILSIDLIAMIFGMPRAAFPELAREVFAGGPQVLGLLYAAPSVGALLAAVTTGWVGSVSRQGRAVFVAVFGWATAITLAGLLIPSLTVVLILLAVAGAADVISAIFRGAILNNNTPDALRGRVNSVNLMVVTGGPRLGDVEAGLVAGVIGARNSVIVGGVACLVGTALLHASSKRLWGYADDEVRRQMEARSTA